MDAIARKDQVIAALGGVEVEIRTDRREVLDYLSEFYALRSELSWAARWVVDARLGAVRPPMESNPYGVGYQAIAQHRRVTLRAPSLFDLQVTARKVVREVFLDDCERRRYAMLHASAVARPDKCQVVLFIGEKRAGKTTLALRCMLDHGWQLLSNDHLIVFADPPVEREGVVPGARLSLTSLPTLIPVKIGTFLDLEGRLPEPWDVQGLDVEAYRAMPVEQRRRLDVGVVYTYRRLGQDNPMLTALDHDAAVTAVLPGYAEPGEEAGPPVAEADPTAALGAHLRTDWPVDPRVNQRHLPHAQRSPAELAADGAALVAALAERATVVAWRHAGDPSPLLHWTESTVAGRR